MELNWRKAAFGALVVAAVVLQLRKQEIKGPTTAVSDRPARLDSLNWLYRRAHLSWTAFSLRDSAARIASAASPGALPTVHWQGFPGRRTEPVDDSVVADFWRTLGPTDPHIVTSILIFNVAQYKHQFYDGAYIKTSGDRTDCVAVVPGFGNPQTPGQPVISPGALHSGLTPCALLAAFGMPRGGAARWMTSSRYAADGSNRWFYVEKHADLTERAPWVYWGNSEGGATPSMMPAVSELLDGLGVMLVAYNLQPPYQFGGSGVRCLAGISRDCSASLVAPGTRPPGDNRMPAELVLGYELQRPDTVTLGTVRPVDGSVVSDLIRQFGRVKFQKFWSSDRELPAAFAEAFGEPLEQWSARWSREIWENSFDAKHRNADVLLGVTLSPSSFPAVIAWSLLMIVVASMVAKRRTA